LHGTIHQNQKRIKQRHAQLYSYKSRKILHHQNTIIIGDLNSKHAQFGCKENNKNGNILKTFISDSEAMNLIKINQLCSQVHQDIKKISSENWDKFITSTGRDHFSTRYIWKK
jgi:hypothetical protein